MVYDPNQPPVVSPWVTMLNNFTTGLQNAQGSGSFAGDLLTGVGAGAAGFGAQREENAQKLYEYKKAESEKARQQALVAGLAGDDQQMRMLAEADPNTFLRMRAEQAFAPEPEPMALNQGQVLVDPTTGKQIAAGQEERQEPIKVGDTLLDPVTYQTLYQGQADAPKPVVVGGALVDPTTGKPIYEAPEEGISPYQQQLLEMDRARLVQDASLSDAQLALDKQKLAQQASQGKIMSGADLGMQDPAAANQMFNVDLDQDGNVRSAKPIMGTPQTVVNTGDKAETAGKVRLAQEQATNLVDLQENLPTRMADASSQIANVDRMLELNEQAPAGFFSGAQALASKAGGLVSPELGEAGRAYDEMNVGFGSLILKASTDLKGALSDKDINFLREAVGQADSMDAATRKNILEKIKTGYTKSQTMLDAQAGGLDAGKTYEQIQKDTRDAVKGGGQTGGSAEDPLGLF